MNNDMKHMTWFFSESNDAPLEASWLTANADAVFTPEECKNIIELGKPYLMDAKLGDGTTNNDVRPSRVCFMPVVDDTLWIYEKIESFIRSVNNTMFHYELLGLSESLQLTEYSAPGGKYDAHIDRMNIGSTVRKLSISFQLSSPDDYDGGELELYTNLRHPEVASKNQGSAFVFNSMLLHRVAPVTRGTRYSLVVWVTGPRFK